MAWSWPANRCRSCGENFLVQVFVGHGGQRGFDGLIDVFGRGRLAQFGAGLLAEHFPQLLPRLLVQIAVGT